MGDAINHPYGSALPPPPRSASGKSGPRFWWLLGGSTVVLLFALGWTVDLVRGHVPRATATAYRTSPPRRVEHGTLSAGQSVVSTRNYTDDIFIVHLNGVTRDADATHPGGGVTIEIDETLETFGTVSRTAPLYTIIGSNGGTYTATQATAQPPHVAQTNGHPPYTTAKTPRSLSFALPAGVTVRALHLQYHLPDGSEADIFFDAP